MREFIETGPAGGMMTVRWARDYVYRGTSFVGSYLDEGGTTKRLHYHLDHLGTTRLTTEATVGAAVGRIAVSDYASGEELELTSGNTETPSLHGTLGRLQRWNGLAEHGLSGLHARTVLQPNRRRILIYRSGLGQ